MQTLKAKQSQIQFDALGTIWWVSAESCTKAAIQECQQIALRFQNEYSRFDKNSTLSRLNLAKTVREPHPEFVKLLRLGVAFHQHTSGSFNITAGSENAARGYGTYGKGLIQSDLLTAISISDNEIRLRNDTNIDFGGFAKGYLVDKLAKHLKNAGASSTLVNGGGDIYYSGVDVIDVPLMLPGDASSYFTKAQINNGALASSSPLIRSWGDNNHLITGGGKSYDGQITQLTVHATDTLYADMAATACIVSNNAYDMARKLGVPIVTTYRDGTFKASPDFPLIKD